MATAPLYLYTGPEAGERTDAISSLKARVQKAAGELDYHLLYATETTVQDVVSLLENGSLFSAARFVVLGNAELIKKEAELAAIKAWAAGAAKHSVPDSYLVLVSEENGVDKKLEALVPKENRTIFWELFENRKEQWILDYFRKNGYGVEPDAVDTILGMVENNTEALKKECSRFFACFQKGCTVTAQDVEQVLANDRTESPFTLFAAMSDSSAQPRARLESSLVILQKLRQSKESSAVQILMLLSSCFRKLRTWHAIDGSAADDFTLRTSGFASKNMQRQYRGAARLWNAEAVDAILALLARTDIDVRSGGAGVEENLLEAALYSIIMKQGRALATYSLL